MTYRNTIPALALSLALLFTACEDTIWIPVRGDIIGVVTDNNGLPLNDVTVSASFEAPTDNGSPQPSTRSSQTDPDGRYSLTELWDRVELSIRHPGFRPEVRIIELQADRDETLDITLLGSPTIVSILADRAILDSAQPDSAHVQIEVEDRYNEQLTGYTVYLLLRDRPSGELAAITAATRSGQSLERFIFETTLQVNELTPGAYTLQAEVTDPDGNTHWLQADQNIEVR